MKKLVIAYHAYLFGDDYMTMINDQFRQLIWSHLFENCHKLYIGVVDNPYKKPSWGVEWISKYFNFSSSKKDEPNQKVEVVIYTGNDELRDTLRWIRDYSKDNLDDYILFFHTKGITCKEQPFVNCAAVNDWRIYMEYFVIEQWRDCIQKLDDGYDACGVLWNSDTNLGLYPHFSGAFYWVKSSFVNTLNHDYLNGGWRYEQEFWIGTNPNIKIFEFHNSRLNDKDAILGGRSHYQVCYPKENYIKL